MKLKLDAKTITGLTLAADEREQFFWGVELTGFGLRVRRRHDGVILRTWTAQYRDRASGRTRRHTLGASAKVSLTAARDAARRILSGAALGHDPAGDKQAKRARARRTFSNTVDAYLAARASALRPNSLRLGVLFLRGDYFAPLFGTPIDEITRADVAACLTAAARRHTSNAAASARRWASTLFGWAIEEGYEMPAGNPVVGTRRPQRAPARDRVLADAELAAIWRSCDGDDDFSKIVRLLILTGARRVEVGGICWSELDPNAGTWTLPAARSKNHRAHTITLPPAALEIIESVSRRACDTLFGSLWGSQRGFATWGRSKGELDARLGFEHAWRLHDIRRTVATGMINIGIEPHHVEAVLNHYSGHRAGVAGVYNKSPYAVQIKSALARWAEQVAALAEGRVGSNVVALRA